MSFLIAFSYFILLIIVVPHIPFIRKSGLSKPATRIFLCIKLVFSALVIIIYTYYYPKNTADIFNYFNDGQILYSALKDNPLDYFRMLFGINGSAPHLQHYYYEMDFWIKEFNYNLLNDNRIVIRFNAFISLFSFGNIYVHGFFMSLVSFIGLIGIYRFLTQHLKVSRIASLISVVFPPSLLFWGSGLLKEGIVLFALGLILFATGMIIDNRKNIFGYLLLLAATTIFSLSKFYVLFALIPAITSHFISYRSKRKILIYTTVHLTIYLAVFILHYSGSQFDIIDIIQRKQYDFINFTRTLGNVGSYIDTPEIATNPFSFTILGLRGFFVTLTRPSVFDISSLITIPAVFENTGIIILIIISLFFIKKQKICWSTLLFTFSFVFILFSLSGMSTPVLGALVRYKIPALPFLFVLIYTIMDYKKALKKIENTFNLKSIRLERTSRFLFIE